MNQPLFLLFIGFCTLTAMAQKPIPTDKQLPRDDRPTSLSRSLNIDAQVTTTGQVTIKGQRVPYKTTAGTIPVYDEEGKAVAGVFFTYFERSDVADRSARPLVISFNGGPDTASVWMMIGYTGPRILKIDDVSSSHKIDVISLLTVAKPELYRLPCPPSRSVEGSKFY